MSAQPLTHIEEWFPRAPDDGDRDARYLRLWREAALTYPPDQPLDATWHHDHYTTVIGHDPTRALFERARHLLMRYRFYPAEVMRSVSDFELEQRPLRVNDRIVQRLHVLRLRDRPVLDVLTMNQVTAVVDEEFRQGFTYTTTQCHAEQGEWTAVVALSAPGQVSLTVRAISRPGPRLRFWAHGLARRLQLRAHQCGLAAFHRLALAQI